MSGNVPRLGAHARLAEMSASCKRGAAKSSPLCRLLIAPPWCGASPSEGLSLIHPAR